ncbi:hypothetical protein [Oleidesulfovibrio alaskensis]|jgi:hypothetical protein|uniref:hypothetical protein n=1 Tax=Oleidesulfovibrio alaskensis TaxID=58180 RepID=UPI001A54A376|nr:hypothetical protein [Oleidesulfovibrio alaskensis]MBL3582608.1 hypothetical protein [Oleidesulfovibrio alaskensis]
MREHDLLALVEKSAETDLPLLLKAKEAAKRLVNENPSAEHLRLLERVSKMLEGVMAAKQSFGSLKEVLEYLQEQGRKISKSKLYQDKSRGLLKAQADGTFRQRDVDRYAGALGLVATPDKEAAEAQEFASRKAKAEAEKLEEQAKAERFKNEVRAGRYILREDVEVELAARAGVLGTGLRTMIETSLLDILHTAQGNPKRAPEVLALFERKLDAALNEYSRPIVYEVTLSDDADDIDAAFSSRPE